MKKTSSDVDGYIAKSADFARPILKKLRSLFHAACPDIEETMKWSFPHFEYKGVVASMAAFKEHVRCGFWKEKLMRDPHKLFAGDGDSAMGNHRIEKLADLPADNVLLEYIREAVALNEEGVKAPKKPAAPKGELEVPDDLQAALKKNKKALAAFEAFSPSHKREYVEWIVEAKQEATRKKRLATAIEWIAEAKSRHWKYQTQK